MLKFAIFLVVCAQAYETVVYPSKLSNCLDDNKYCFGHPRGCVGPNCYLTYSAIANGTHVEMELLGQEMRRNSFIAMGYSSDSKMGDDFVIFCINDDGSRESERKVGLAYNSDKHKNEMQGTIDELKLKDKYKLDLQLIDYSYENEAVYCKLTHRVDKIIDHFNASNVQILLTKGVWMKDNLSYHGAVRHVSGQLNLNGEKKKKRRSSSSVFGIIPSILLVIACKIFDF